MKKGFTLLEMLVAVAIVGLIGVVLSQVFISTLRSNTKTEILKEMKQNAELSMETIVRMVQNAKDITYCDTSGSPQESITITNPDGYDTVLGCIQDGTAFRLASTSANGTVFLTSENVTLGGTNCSNSSIVFVCNGSDGTPSTVTVSFTLSQVGIPDAAFEQSSQSFKTSATMRNTAQ